LIFRAINVPVARRGWELRPVARRGENFGRVFAVLALLALDMGVDGARGELINAAGLVLG
jgi:hypothetical protein